MTIPFTPRFLVVAATALAAKTPVLAGPNGERKTMRQQWDPRVSFDFVQRIGHTSHLRWAAEYSSWPLGGIGTIDEAAALAASHGVLLQEPAQGAIALVANRANGPKRSAWSQCGVVIEVAETECSRLPGAKQWTVDVAWGVRAAAGYMRGEIARHRFDQALGDAFIHWWELPDARDVPSASTMRGAEAPLLWAA